MKQSPKNNTSGKARSRPRSSSQTTQTTPGKSWIDCDARPLGHGMTLHQETLKRPSKATGVIATIAALGIVCIVGAFLQTAHAQEIVQCGNRYSDRPEPGCKILAGAAPGNSGTSDSAFHIDGVRLGMTPEQATAALSRHFGVPISAIRNANGEVSYIRQAAPARAIGVKFGIDPATKTLRAQTIIAGQPGAAAGRRAMLAQTVSRYGEPTVNVTAGQFDLWCAKPSPLQGSNLPTCVPNTPQLFLFNGGFGPPFATLTQGGPLMSTWDTLALVVAPS